LNYTENDKNKYEFVLSFSNLNQVDMSTFEEQLLQVTELITLPEIYLKIHRLMDDPTSEIDDFAAVIRLDPNLSAKLLKAVNSAYYGFSGEINNISRAVTMIGIQQLHIMVLSISAVTAVSSLNFPKDIIDLKTFWRSSLLSGTLSRALAQHLKIQPSERFFMLGLLHEIGHLVLYANFPDKARQTIDFARENQITINQAEQQVLGCHYGKIGAILMQQWKLPKNFQTITQFQPTPEQSNEELIETSIMHIAHAYAHRQFIESDKEVTDLINPSAWQAADLNEEIVNQSLPAALLTCAEMEKVIFK
jgi:HD-like signal output (HDOD) protein